MQVIAGKAAMLCVTYGNGFHRWSPVRCGGESGIWQFLVNDL